jgi:ASC-1-like (ASCH) protein
LIMFGIKKVLTLAKSDIENDNHLIVGDSFFIRNTDFQTPRVFLVTITQINHYKNIRELINSEGLDRFMPGIATPEEAIWIYYGAASHEFEDTHGVVCLTIEVN